MATLTSQALVEGHTDMYDDMGGAMMMGGANMRESENSLGKAMNVFSLVCSVLGLGLCGLMFVAALAIVIFLASVGLLVA